MNGKLVFKLKSKYIFWVNCTTNHRLKKSKTLRFKHFESAAAEKILKEEKIYVRNEMQQTSLSYDK